MTMKGKKKCNDALGLTELMLQIQAVVLMEQSIKLLKWGDQPKEVLFQIDLIKDNVDKIKKRLCSSEKGQMIYDDVC